LFYIGSTFSFSGEKNSRLVKYFQPSRLVRTETSKHISVDIAEAMLKYPKSHWNLIILEICGKSEELTTSAVFAREQFWMLLIPTYNRSLVVGTPDPRPMPEEQRQARSIVMYRYTAKEGAIVPGSELKIFGVKEMSRVLNISLYDLQAYRKSGQLYKGKYLFCDSPLTSEEQLLWKDPTVSVKSTRASKFTPVWVYDALTLKFIEKHSSVKSVKAKYNISQSSMNRCLNHRLPYNGRIFSRVELTQ